jgi:hypothetical protein
LSPFVLGGGLNPSDPYSLIPQADESEGQEKQTEEERWELTKKEQENRTLIPSTKNSERTRKELPRWRKKDKEQRPRMEMQDIFISLSK